MLLTTSITTTVWKKKQRESVNNQKWYIKNLFVQPKIKASVKNTTDLLTQIMTFSSFNTK